MSSLDRRLEPQVQTHLKKVYSTLAISVLSASIGGYVHLYTSLSNVIGGFLNFIFMTGLLIALYSTPDNGKNQPLRLNYLLGFSFFSGFGLGSLIEHSLYINPSILPTAFMATALIFACFTISAIYGDRRKTLFYGGILFSGLSLLTYMSLINLFFRSQLMFKAYVYIAFAIMCAFVIYDTAFIIEKRLRGDTDYIGHSILLFMDLISIFRHLLILLTEKERNDRRKRNRN
ncbi:bax inhibitor-like protein [Dermatophagoides farinae]|nr:bax inhibitor 1-like [Dermatophagoides farinae]KAH7637759.1 bax inhibitor-like protein [Dermatophagoides farinae]